MLFAKNAWEQCKLGESASFSKGNGYTKNDLEPSGIPIYMEDFIPNMRQK